MKFLLWAAVAPMLAVLSPAADAGDVWQTHCQARQEVHDVQSNGQCQALFKLNADGDALEYKLFASNLEYVTQAHIHLAPAGINGGVVAFLFGFVPEGVIPNGLLSQGMITDADLVGSLSGMTIFELIAEMDAGHAYVNVHTLANPAGEVRGQIK